MALDNEDLNRRRQQRENLRKARQAQQRKLIVQLIAAATVLILCGVFIFTFTKGDGQPKPSAQTPTTQPPTEAPTTVPAETEPPKKDPASVVHIAAAGDLNVNDTSVEAGGPGYDYSQVFMDVLPLLSQADLTVLNFEGSLFGTPYGSSTYSAPQSLVQALSSTGVDLLQAANSRSISNGILGLASTLQNIRAAGIEPLGAYATPSEFKKSGGYTIREVNGIKIAFVAFTKGMDGMALPTGSEHCVNLLYTDYASTYQKVDTSGITSILKSVAAEKPDITIALLHWGSEFNDQLSSTQKQIAELMLEQGVDVILGTHSHYVQKMEFNEDSGTFVAYSLGDFYGDASRPGTEYSIVLDLEITKDTETGVTKVTNFSYVPIFTVAEEDKPLRVVRIQQAIEEYQSNYIGSVTKETYDAMLYALERIEARIHPEE